MKRTTDEMIKDSVARGYEFFEEGYGKQEESKLNEYREQGYDVKAWYVPSDVEGTKKWVLYAKKKVRRVTKSEKRVTVMNYSSFTVKELRKLCSEKKISGYSKLNKNDMILKLMKAN